MNLYLISQKKKNGYDTYDAAVVCAESAEDARDIHPQGKKLHELAPDQVFDWCATRDSVDAIFLGIADESIKAGVVLASFHAG